MDQTIKSEHLLEGYGLEFSYGGAVCFVIQSGSIDQTRHHVRLNFFLAIVV